MANFPGDRLFSDAAATSCFSDSLGFTWATVAFKYSPQSPITANIKTALKTTSSNFLVASEAFRDRSKIFFKRLSIFERDNFDIGRQIFLLDGQMFLFFYFLIKGFG